MAHVIKAREAYEKNWDKIKAGSFILGCAEIANPIPLSKDWKRAYVYLNQKEVLNMSTGNIETIDNVVRDNLYISNFEYRKPIDTSSKEIKKILRIGFFGGYKRRLNKAISSGNVEKIIKLVSAITGSQVDIDNICSIISKKYSRIF